MPDRTDDDILDAKALATAFGVSQRILLEMVRNGRAPRPIGGAKPPYRWRWGAVRKWHDAMETLYGVGFVGVDFGRKLTENDDSEQKDADDPGATSGTKSKR